MHRENTLKLRYRNVLRMTAQWRIDRCKRFHIFLHFYWTAVALSSKSKGHH